MSRHPPPGFQRLSATLEGAPMSQCSVIGLVTDVMEPAITRTGRVLTYNTASIESLMQTEFMKTWSINDHDFYLSTGNTRGVKMRSFTHVESELPLVHVGDIISAVTVTVRPDDPSLANRSQVDAYRKWCSLDPMTAY